jgi:hypothetical protein
VCRAEFFAPDEKREVLGLWGKHRTNHPKDANSGREKRSKEYCISTVTTVCFELIFEWLAAGKKQWASIQNTNLYCGSEETR